MNSDELIQFITDNLEIELDVKRNIGDDIKITASLKLNGKCISESETWIDIDKDLFI